MGQQALVQLAGEQGNAVHPGVVAEEVAGHADPAAASGDQYVLIEVGPLVDWLLSGQLGSAEAELDHVGEQRSSMPVLVGISPRVEASGSLARDLPLSAVPMPRACQGLRLRPAGALLPGM